MNKRSVCEEQPEEAYEFCPRCEANLTLQKGYHNELPYWICKGCGEMLINPTVPGEIAWICDGCNTMLNIQAGFTEEGNCWKCTECGHINCLEQSELYMSEEEYQVEAKSVYKGLSEQDVLTLSSYEELVAMNGREDVFIIRDPETQHSYVKKILSIFDRSVYQYLREHPVSCMPKIWDLFEGDNYLIVIEEYVEGQNLQVLLEESLFGVKQAVMVARDVCRIIMQLHALQPPLIHRDIKPSNVMISSEGITYLLDMNVAKWYDSYETEDTKLLGTQHYAAPEQLGYGFHGSSEQSDIYAIGMLLNVMITGHFPKEEKAPEPIWHIIEKCIQLNPEDRYTDQELLDALSSVLEFPF